MKVNMNYQNFHYLMRVLIIYLDAARSIINTMPKLIFIGDYSKLQRMGFTFQKLFSDRRMCWVKDDLRICKKQKSFCYYFLPQKILIELILRIQGGIQYQNLCTETMFNGVATEVIYAAIDNVTSEVTFDSNKIIEYQKQSADAYSRNDTAFEYNKYNIQCIDEKIFNEINQFVDLRWLVVSI